MPHHAARRDRRKSPQLMMTSGGVKTGLPSMSGTQTEAFGITSFVQPKETRESLNPYATIDASLCYDSRVCVGRTWSLSAICEDTCADSQAVMRDFDQHSGTVPTLSSIQPTNNSRSLLCCGSFNQLQNYSIVTMCSSIILEQGLYRQALPPQAGQVGEMTVWSGDVVRKRQAQCMRISWLWILRSWESGGILYGRSTSTQGNIFIAIDRPSLKSILAAHAPVGVNSLKSMGSDVFFSNMNKVLLASSHGINIEPDGLMWLVEKVHNTLVRGLPTARSRPKLVEQIQLHWGDPSP
ncbi:hypothetical protein PV04_10436 [Phialophora macrospora]|uniref:Uncharacterized protein n=1 Tax=Phialophora macrospora TaxID=1851006 RepID=A0A0D2CB72_9EURO|nr:hypothetical protein PV04_10436 [Phialophora macrospora]